MSPAIDHSKPTNPAAFRLWRLWSECRLPRLLTLDLLDGLQNPAPNDRTVYISRLQKAISRFTTFSSFSPQGPNLALDGQWMPASFYIVGSVLLCLIGVWLGHGLGIAINR